MASSFGSAQAPSNHPQNLADFQVPHQLLLVRPGPLRTGSRLLDSSLPQNPIELIN
jgi:hypothetical protein